MGKNMKIKASIKNNVLKAKIQATHIMITYDAAKKKGVEANFITQFTAKVGDKVVFEASTSQFLSKDPIFKFQTKADGIKSGDKLTVTWTDLLGNTVTEDKAIK
jgi:sulfur-oxidizing protein SoxZ